MTDSAKQTRYEADVVAFGSDGAVLSVGALLTSRGRHGAETAQLTCFSVAGFTDELREQAEINDEVVLVGAADLYR